MSRDGGRHDGDEQPAHECCNRVQSDGVHRYVSMLMVGGLQYKEQFNTPFRTCVTRSRERVGLHRRGGTRVPCFGREALGPYDSREPIAGIVRAAKVPLPAFSVFAWESTEFTRIN